VDEWVSPAVLHFIHEICQLQALSIACSQLPHPHTPGTLQLKLGLIVWVPTSRDITTDGGRNVIAMTNEAEHQRMPSSWSCDNEHFRTS
jgi:hypothetical protein